MEEKKNDNTLLICLALLALFMVTWYSVFAQPLAFNNEQVKPGVWDIRFTDVSEAKITGSAKALRKPDYTSTKATFDVLLTSPGDKLTYTFKIKNTGNLDAVLDGIYILPANNDNDPILYYTSGLSVGDSLLAGDEVQVDITALYNPAMTQSTNVNSKSVSIIFNYVQKS